jgi:hypothetical protein
MSESISTTSPALTVLWSGNQPINFSRKLTRSQPSMRAGERSGLLAHTATTESVSLCVRIEKLTAFIQLESAISDLS